MNSIQILQISTKLHLIKALCIIKRSKTNSIIILYLYNTFVDTLIKKK